MRTYPRSPARASRSRPRSRRDPATGEHSVAGGRGMVRPLSTKIARACANIALVKYWGKRPGPLNVPAAGSLSLSLDALVTTTQVTFDAGMPSDELVLDGAVAQPGELARASQLLDLVRARAGIRARARVISRNEFPTASGLASSALG